MWGWAVPWGRSLTLGKARSWVVRPHGSSLGTAAPRGASGGQSPGDASGGGRDSWAPPGCCRPLATAWESEPHLLAGETLPWKLARPLPGSDVVWHGKGLASGAWLWGHPGTPWGVPAWARGCTGGCMHEGGCTPVPVRIPSCACEYPQLCPCASPAVCASQLCLCTFLFMCQPQLCARPQLCAHCQGCVTLHPARCPQALWDTLAALLPRTGP